MSVFVAVGVQWGDEGKGKIVDAIASSFSWIVRGQGGPNAGHSVSINGKEFFFHLIPSGATHPEIKLYIGAGAVIDPISFYKEVLTLEKEGIPYRGRLFLSPKMQVILPFHRKLDGYIESLRSGSPIGTTKRGMGPVYADKALRFGVPLADWLEGKEGCEGSGPWREYFEEKFRAAGIVVPFSHNEKGERSQSWSTDYLDVGGAVNLYGLDSYPGGLSCTNLNSGFNLVRNYYQWFSNYS